MACIVILLFVFPNQCIGFAAENKMPFDVDASSAVLMDAGTGEILYAKNEDEALPPASVTKIMTLLLIMEEIDNGRMTWTEQITVSDYAASMGGSQVYLEPGEQMSAQELVKCIVVSSANDAAVTMAERISGSEEAFVAKMNERAAELGMEHTRFENATGLDDDTVHHLTSAKDIAIMSRELLKHDQILNYTTIWMDTIRGGAFGLSNTNRLIRFYNGATGLKTGSTSKAKFCISATAQRENMHLIAVIMGSPTRDIRNEEARKLLDWGFANYTVYENPTAELDGIHVYGGVSEQCRGVYEAFSCVTKKGTEKEITYEVLIPEEIPAPVRKGDVIGQVIYRRGEEIIGQCDITAMDDIAKLSFGTLFLRMLKTALLPF